MSIKLPDIAFDDIACLLDNIERMPIFHQLDEELPGGFSRDDLFDFFTKKLGVGNETANRILRVIFSLVGIRERSGLNPDELFREITDTLLLDSTLEWKSSYLEKWEKSEGLIKQIFDADSPLALLEKEEALAYRYDNIYASAKIITDIRPVFNDEGDSIQRAVIMHLLTVDYRDSRGQMNQIALALDLQDVRDLRRLCERAEKKAFATKEAISKLPWHSLIKGEK